MASTAVATGSGGAPASVTVPADRVGTMPPAGAAGKKATHKMFKFGPVAPGLMLLGTILWLVGSALFAGSQERASLPFLQVNPFPVFGSGAIIDSGLRTGAWVLYIIASCCFVVGSLLYLLRTTTMAALSTVRIIDGRPVHGWEMQGAAPMATTVNPMRSGTAAGSGTVYTPGTAKWAVVGAWMQFIASIVVLVGSAVWSSGSWDGVGAGGIILLVGFTMWGIAMLIALGVAFVVSTIIKFIGDFDQRRYAWNSFASTVFQLVQYTLFALASIALIVRDPPGLWLSSALLYLIGSIYGMWGWMTAMRGATVFMGPLFGYTTAAYVMGAGEGGMAGAAAAGAGAGALAAKGMGTGGMGTGTPATSSSAVPAKQYQLMGPTTTGMAAGSAMGATSVPMAEPALAPASSDVPPPRAIEASTGAPVEGMGGTVPANSTAVDMGPRM